MFINDIKKNEDNIFEQDEFSNFIIRPVYKRLNILDVAKLDYSKI